MNGKKNKATISQFDRSCKYLSKSNGDDFSSIPAIICCIFPTNS